MERVNIETERQDLFDVSIVIAMRFHIRGNVSETAIRTAFDRAVKYHEILGTRVKKDENDIAYYEKPDNMSPDKESDISSFDSNKILFEESDWLSIIRREEKKRFRIEEGEFIRGFVYASDDDVNVGSSAESTGEGIDILFMMHHLGGDGKSLVYFIETFMKYLSENDPQTLEDIEISKFIDEVKGDLERKEERNSLEMRTIPAGDLSDEALKDRVGPLALMPKIFNKQWLKDPKRQTFSFEDMDKAYEEYWSTRESEIKEYIISPEQTAKIHARCKEWNIGFTAYITTSFLRRMGRKLDIGYAVDAREDGNRSMGNQATGISIKYSYNYDKSFRKNAEKVQRLLTKKLEDEEARNFVLPFMAAFEPSLVDAINLEHAGTFKSKTSRKLANILGYRKKTKDLSISNLTRLDIPDTYGSLKIDFLSFIPPVISYGKNIIGLSTIGDCTIMTIHRIK